MKLLEKFGINSNTEGKTKFDPNFKGSGGQDFIEFFAGFLLLGGGVFWLLNTFSVTTSYGFGYHIGGFRLNSGVMLLPLLIGVLLVFFLPGKKRYIGFAVAALGLLCIVLALISSVSITLRHTSLFSFVFMLAMIFSGAGLLIRSISRKK